MHVRVLIQIYSIQQLQHVFLWYTSFWTRIRHEDEAFQRQGKGYIFCQ